MKCKFYHVTQILGYLAKPEHYRLGHLYSLTLKCHYLLSYFTLVKCKVKYNFVY